MTKKGISRVLFATTLAVALVIAMVLVGGCAGEAPPTEGPPTEGPPQEEVFELTFADMHPPTNCMNAYILPGWFDWLEEESGGRIKVTLLPACEAAAPADLYDAARTGIADMACQMYTSVPGRFPLGEVTTLPGVFGWPGSMGCALTTMALHDKYPELMADHSEVKVLGFHASGTHQIWTREKPIRTMEDLSGQVIEAVGYYEAIALNELGATPESLPWPDVYDALAKGVLDGTCSATEGMIVWNEVDVTKHGVEANLSMDIWIHVMNLDTWNSLPSDLQELFLPGGSFASGMPWRLTTLYAYQFDKDETIYRDVINEEFVAKGGSEFYVLPEAEKARWLAAMEPVWEAWVEQAAATIGEAKARAILEDCRTFAEQYSYENYTPTVSDWCEEQFEEWGYKWGTSGRPELGG